VYEGENFNPNNETPGKSIPTETRHLTQKTESIRAKLWSPEAGKKFYNKNL